MTNGYDCVQKMSIFAPRFIIKLLFWFFKLFFIKSSFTQDTRVACISGLYDIYFPLFS